MTDEQRRMTLEDKIKAAAVTLCEQYGYAVLPGLVYFDHDAKRWVFSHWTFNGNGSTEGAPHPFQLIEQALRENV
jgi:hypothetical protein